MPVRVVQVKKVLSLLLRRSAAVAESTAAGCHCTRQASGAHRSARCCCARRSRLRLRRAERATRVKPWCAAYSAMLKLKGGEGGGEEEGCKVK